LTAKYNALSEKDKQGPKGAQLRAMMTAATLPRDLAQTYAEKIDRLLETEADEQRRTQLTRMRVNLRLVPWQPPQDFWQALQALWITHMLILSDENYPGAGVSFGRLDQYMLPYYQQSLAAGMNREFIKEILKCFWLHCNYAYDAMIATGDPQGPIHLAHRQ
jgi:pyruvate-formate lyase